jgi:hypothetical protein
MDTREQQELEKFIHEQLQKLPERAAPDALVSNVLTAIVAKQERPWWKQPFTSWPKGSQIVLFVFLSGLLGSLAYAFSGPVEHLSLSALYERALSLAWVADLVRTLANAFVVMLKGATLYWLLAAAAVIVMMYAACIAGGVALYRITSSSSLKNI